MTFACVAPIQEVLLAKVFRAGFQESAIAVGDDKPIQRAREVRSSQWYHSLGSGGGGADYRRRKRQKLLCTQAGKHLPFFENVLVDHFGLDWRDLRNQFVSFSDWKKEHWRNFLESTCKRWNLGSRGRMRHSFLREYQAKGTRWTNLLFHNQI